MELIIGKTAGFCFGVKNAINKTYEQINNNTKNLYCLGELVHNERIVENFNKRGVTTIDEITDIPNNSNVIIRAHGVNPKVYNTAQEKNINIIDLTCPKVAKIHELAQEFANNNYYIFLIAEKNHPETIGTKGFCGEKSSIIEDLEDIPNAIECFNKSNLEKIAIIAQTTFGVQKFKIIVDEIQSKVNCKIDIKDTICNATTMRQAETEELSKSVDLMIIIGGKNSANTKRLYDISVKNCPHSILIQNKEDNDLIETLKNKFNKIGIMAGASTPEESIDEVVEYIRSIGGINEFSK